MFPQLYEGSQMFFSRFGLQAEYCYFSPLAVQLLGLACYFASDVYLICPDVTSG